MSDIPSFASIYGGVFIACIGGFAALFFIKGLIESVKMSREADGKSDSYKKIVRADLSEIEALRRVAVEARYYLLHGGSLADLEMALSDAGYGGGE